MGINTPGNSPFPTSDAPPYGGTVDDGMRSGIGSDAADAVNRVKQGAHDAVDRLADKAGPAVERIRTKVSGLSDTVQAKAEQFGALEEQWVESCRATVREHPLATVAMAVAAGVLLSKILSSSR